MPSSRDMTPAVVASSSSSSKSLLAPWEEAALSGVTDSTTQDNTAATSLSCLDRALAHRRRRQPPSSSSSASAAAAPRPPRRPVSSATPPTASLLQLQHQRSTGRPQLPKDTASATNSVCAEPSRVRCAPVGAKSTSGHSRGTSNEAAATLAAATYSDPAVTPPVVLQSSLCGVLLHAQLYTSTGAYLQQLTTDEEATSEMDIDSIRGYTSARTLGADNASSVSSPLSSAPSSRRHRRYFLQLRSRSRLLSRLLASIGSVSGAADDLLRHFGGVFESTNSVREECAAMMEEQIALAAETFKIRYHLSYFGEMRQMQQAIAEEQGRPTPMSRFMRDYRDGAQLTAAGTNTNLALVGTASSSVFDPTLVSSPTAPLPALLTSLDQCLSYMRENSDFLESASSRARYEQLQRDLLRRVRNCVRDNLETAIRRAEQTNATQQAGNKTASQVEPTGANGSNGSGVAPQLPAATAGAESTEARWMRLFVQLRSVAHALRPLMREMEHRADAAPETSEEGKEEARAYASTAVAASSSSSSSSSGTTAVSVVSAQSAPYADVLTDCYHIYCSRRQSLLSSHLHRLLHGLVHSGRSLSNLVRSACLTWIDLCTRESDLFRQLFSARPAATVALQSMLADACSMLYTTLRPIIIQSLDMDALAECITILKGEIVEDRLQPADHAAATSERRERDASTPVVALPLSSPLHAFSQSIHRLIADVQERLIYRAQIYIRDAIQKYPNTQADLDYPNKLVRAAGGDTGSTTNNGNEAAAVDATSSSSSSSSSSSLSPPTSSSSRSALFSTWHPSLERTLMCLSKLYRCVEVSVFRYLAQEAVSVCTTVLIDASNVITAAHAAKPSASDDDGALFLIQHLLILRDQLTPFAGVDFTVTETDLDFSHMRDVLPNIFSSVGKWSSFLEIVQNSAPRIKESKRDAKKSLDASLKSSCEQLIAHQTQSLIGPLLAFFNEMGARQQSGDATHQPKEFHATLVKLVEQMTGPADAPTATSPVSAGVHAPLARFASSPFARQLARLSTQTRLYLANPSTERVICRPIHRTVAEVLEQLKFFVRTHFQEEESTTTAAAAAPASAVPTAEYLGDSITRLEEMLRAHWTD